jgi:type VI protein secretion system component Hcp
MRFDGRWAGKQLRGDSSDDQHPGEFAEGEDKRDRKDGWVQIKKFSFGFGGEKSDALQKSTSTLPTEKDPVKQVEALKKAIAARDKAEKKAQTQAKEGWGKSGPLNFDKFSFTKATDRLSPVLTQISHAGGYKIPMVEVEAVRYGGTGDSFKIPFLRVIFKNVYITSCKLNLVNEESPSEDIEFEYDSLEMETLWTDNATGDRAPGDPVRVGWDLPNQKHL